MAHSETQAASELLSYADNLLIHETHENVTAQSLLAQLRNVDIDLPWRQVAERALEERGESPPRRGHVQMIVLGLRDALQSCAMH